MNKDKVLKLVNCEITWKEVSSKENITSYLLGIEDFIINIDTNIVNNAIQVCLDGKHTKKDLLDWANVVRYSEIFAFSEDSSDCIISILDRIEESDEEGCELSNDDLKQMLEKLKQNKMW